MNAGTFCVILREILDHKYEVLISMCVCVCVCVCVCKHDNSKINDLGS